MPDHDPEAKLDFVDPDRRDEVRRRIQVIEQYLADDRWGAGKKAAADLGLGPTQFYALVRAWREGADPQDLAGARRRKPPRSLIGDEQMTLLRELEGASDEHVPVEHIVAAAEAAASARGLALPSRFALRRHVAELRRARLGAAPAGVGLLLDHCALDLAVIAPDGSATMAVASIMLDLEHRTPVGVALSSDAPGPDTAARALLDALARLDEADRQEGAPVPLALDVDAAEAWTDLRRAAARAGLLVQIKDTTRISAGRAAMRLLGPKLAGFRLKAGSTLRPWRDRPPSFGPIPVQEAERVLRGRLEPIGTASPLVRLAPGARARLRDELHELAGAIR